MEKSPDSLSAEDIPTVDAQLKVAIIGRPNVGKSSLFNVLTDSRKAVVKNQPGVTRDIIIERAEVWGRSFDLIDTGGLTEAQDTFSKLIREQVSEFLDTVDLLLVVMDGRAGLVPEDREVFRLAKETGKPFAVIVNKIDRQHEEQNLLVDFYEFGETLIPTSFETRRGLAQVLEWIHERVPEQKQVADKGLHIAIVGKPNVGKSSLVNAVLGEHRMLVSSIAGTTVDSVDTPFIYGGKTYTLVDTAGLRRSRKREEDVEIIAAFKSQESIRRANLVLLVIDALEGPSDQDARILQTALEDHKCVLIVANKVDLDEVSRETFRGQVEKVFHFFVDVPLVFTSAKTGKGLIDLMKEVERLGQRMRTKIATSALNEFFFATIRKAPAPVYGTKNVKFYYLTQTLQTPPSFIAFANHPDGVDNSYRRFLIKNLKAQFDFWGLPIRIFVMKSRGRTSGTSERENA